MSAAAFQPNDLEKSIPDNIKNLLTKRHGFLQILHIFCAQRMDKINKHISAIKKTLCAQAVKKIDLLLGQTLINQISRDFFQNGRNP